MKAKLLAAALAAALTAGATTSCIRIYEYAPAPDSSKAKKTNVTTRSFSGTTINNGSFAVSINDKAEKTVRKEIAISPFTKIDASQRIQVICDLTAPTGKAIVETTPEGEKYLDVRVVNGELQVSYVLPSDLRGTIDLATIVRVSAKSLTEVDLSSAASLTVNGSWKESGKIEVELSSAASVMAGEIECSKLDIDASSAGSFTATGLKGNLSVDLSSAAKANIGTVNATKINLEASSASAIVINNLSATEVDVDASSASNVILSSVKCDSLEIEATSSATVNANGTWKNINRSASSNASVTLTKQ